MTLAPFRKRFLKTALELMNVGYVWGGKSTAGIDCSGVVTLSLAVASNHSVDWRHTHNADALWDKLDPTDNPAHGDLAFYDRLGDGRIDHVMVVLCGGFVFGACGGDESSINAEISLALGHKVKVQTSVNYRTDFIGYRRLPEAIWESA